MAIIFAFDLRFRFDYLSCAFADYFLLMMIRRFAA